MSKAWTIAKINFRQIKTAYFITGMVLLTMAANYLLGVFLPHTEDNTTVSMGNMLILLVILAAVFIPAANLRKMMNLGAGRNDFYWGCIPVYVLLSAAVTLAILLFHGTVDRLMRSHVHGILDVIEVFGFVSRGPVVAFVQLFSLLLLVASFTHTLTVMQNAWYGWAADTLLIAVISVFTPIAPLRALEARFFNLIIFGNPALQVMSCLILAAAFYALSRPALHRKKR